MTHLTRTITVLLCVVSAWSSSWVVANDQLLNAFPPSPLAAMTPEHWQLDIAPQYSPSGSAWAIDFDESEVFQTLLSHRQPAVVCALEAKDCQPSLASDWELRIGLGGQIYSLRNDSLGEAMPPQFRGKAKGKFGNNYAPWVDEVLQIVSVNTNLNKANKYFMHGSGVYLKDPLLTKPFYNPLLVSGLGWQDNSYVSVNWAQQAHVETPWRSHAIYYNQFRDVGRGVIEVTSMVYNYAERPLNYFNFPWGGARTTTFGEYIFSKPDGSFSQDPSHPQFNLGKSKNYADTGGWMAYAQGDSAESLAMAVVFGFDQSPRPDFQRRSSRFRYGYAGGKVKPEPTQWRNYQVGAGIRVFNVEPGQGVWVRWYLALGKLGELNQIIAEHELAKKAGYGLLNFTTDNAQQIEWFIDGSKVTRSPIGKQARVFYTFAQPVNNSIPLFRVTDRQGKQFITTNPYQLSKEYRNKESVSLYKSYDGETTRWQLMGYVMPVSVLSKHKGNYSNYQELNAVLSAEIYRHNANTVAVAVLTDEFVNKGPK